MLGIASLLIPYFLGAAEQNCEGLILIILIIKTYSKSKIRYIAYYNDMTKHPIDYGFETLKIKFSNYKFVRDLLI